MIVRKTGISAIQHGKKPLSNFINQSREKNLELRETLKKKNTNSGKESIKNIANFGKRSRNYFVNMANLLLKNIAKFNKRSQKSEFCQLIMEEALILAIDQKNTKFSYQIMNVFITL